MKANQIEDYFQQIERQILTFSEDRMIVQAMKAFKVAFSAVDRELEFPPAELEGIARTVESYYEQEFLPRLRRNSADEVTIDYRPPLGSKTKLQYYYLAANPNEVGSKHLLDNAGDGSRYSRVHELYHPIIRSYLEKFGYYDIFLVDHETGDILYTVFKEVDFATSLLTGPYRGTNFASAFRAARGATDKDYVRLVDFAPYAPSYNAPAAFIASPIFDGEEQVGVMVFQMPIDRINDIMTSRQEWSKVGLGQSGETYIVGEDYLLRNQSRFLIEDSTNYYRAIRDAGLPPDTIDRIRNLGSAVGLQRVRTEGTEAALLGETGTRIFPDYRNVPVLSSFKPLAIRDVNWVIMSEIDVAEAFAFVRSLGRTILITSVILLALVAAIAVFFSRSITSPLASLTAHATELAKGNMEVDIDLARRDEIGTLASSFEVMRQSVKQLLAEQEENNRTLEARVAERTETITAQTEAIMQMATPITQIWGGVLLLPVVGMIDTGRAQDIMDAVLDKVLETRAPLCILDISGVAVVDTAVANHLIKITKAAHLMGCETIISGMSPAITQTVIDLGIDVEEIKTAAAMGDALAVAFKTLGMEIRDAV